MRQRVIHFYLLFFLLTIPWVHNLGQTSNPKVQVSGVVLDQNKEPLTGVTVKLKQSFAGTVTDIDGKYTIQVPAGKATLVFSYVGFQTQEVPVKGATLNVELEEDIKELEDVVVIGYGSMKKRDLSGAISSVESELIEAQSPTNVFDALQGQVAGVEIITGSGAPGEESVVRVRGTATFEAGANPLYVVDGVILDNIDDINPNDIASIEVLKDAASAAIYGSRSANGVFLVTTKQGTSAPKLDIRYVLSFSDLIRKMPQATSAERKYYEKVRGAISRSRLNVGAGGAVTDTLRNLYNQNLDMQDLIFRTAVRNDINLSASGATPNSNFKYYINAGYLNEQGIIINSSYDRLTFRINSDYTPSRKVSLSTKMSASYTDKNGISESGVLNSLLERVPYWAVFNPDASLVPNISSRANPYAVAMTDIDKTQTYKGTIYQSFKYTFNKQFIGNSNIQVNYNNQRYQWYRNSQQLSSTAKTTGKDNTKLNYDWSNENYLSYKQSFGENTHNVNAMVGCSFQAWHVENLFMTGLDYTTNEIYTLNAASDYDVKNTYTRFFEHRMASFFGRAGYNYKSRYIFNANLRYDGSSRFGKDNRWGAFPSASAAWRFSSESFTKWMKPFVSDAKLRVSYGITGNENIGDYVSMLLYAPDFIYEDKGENISGIGASNLGYEGLSWEETAQFNVGLDLRFFKNRINIVTDYYYKATDRLLNRVQLPKEIGFKTMYKNVGSMSNEGLEFSASWDIIRNKKMRWNVNGNIATNISKVTKIADGIPFYKGTNDAIYVQEGHKIGEFYGYKYLNIFQYDESNAYTDKWEQLNPIFNSDGSFSHYTLNGATYAGTIKQKTTSDGETVLKGGDVNFEDVNQNGQVDLGDKQLIGCAQPDFFGGASTTFSYRGFSVYVSLVYSVGGEIYNYAEGKRNANRLDGCTPSPDAIHRMWTKPGDQAAYPAPINFEHNMLAPSDFYLEDASYIKLKNVKISYDLPSKLSKKLHVRALTLAVYGKNLLTFTDYTGYDPEFGSNSDPLTMNIDSNRYPRKREFGVNLNVGF